MSKGGGGKSKKEIEAEMQMNRENQASYERMANASMEAARAQASATLEAAKVNANAQLEAAKVQAQAATEAAKAQADAAIKTSQNAAMGGIIGAALGAHTTTEEIKQWLPSEVAAETMRSWDLAMKWNKTLSMKQAGYQDVAINYELSGKKGQTLFNDAQWNALEMGRRIKQDMMTNIRMFGVQSASNPSGIPISKEDWLNMNSLKDPSEMLKVDPGVAAQRQKEFQQWEAQMRAEGKGILVDIYKNPQLGGSSILTMKGKDPLLDPSLAPLLGSIMSDTGPGGTAGGGGGVNWNQAIDALTKGETNPMTGQIKWAQQNGLIDKYGMINSGVLLSFIPPHLQESPQFNFKKNLTQEEQIALMSQYDQYSNMVNDPKLIREQNVGFGVTRRTKLNPDGTIAASAMEGYMNDAMGNPVWVSVQGNSLKEFYDMKMLAGPMFPGDRVLAPVTQEEMSGRFEPGFWHQNQFAKPRNKADSFAPGAQGTPQMAGTNPYKPPAEGSTAGAAAPGVSKPPAAAEGSEGGGKNAPATAGTLGKALVGQSSMPSGYEGAPLAAGE